MAGQSFDPVLLGVGNVLNEGWTWLDGPVNCLNGVRTLLDGLVSHHYGARHLAGWACELS